MVLYLKENVILELKDGKPVLYTTDGSSPVHILHPISALTLALLHGTDNSDVIHMLSSILGISEDKAKEIVLSVEYRYKPFLTSKPPSVPREIDPSEFLRSSSSPPLRFAAPIGMNWIVTRYCTRRCIYCSAGAIWGKSALDSVLSLGRYKEIIDEAARIGVRNLLFTGGEPFLRSDLPQGIRYAVEKGLEVTVSTKASLSRNQLLSLKGAKLVQVSLDSSDPTVADRMTGSHGFFGQITRTINKLVELGIPVQISSVVTSLNLEQVGQLVEMAGNMGVKAILFTRYVRTLGRHDPGLFVTDEEWNRAFRMAMEAKDRIKGDLDVWIDPEEGVKEGMSSKIKESLKREGMLCAVGKRVLSFRWDGKVPWCEQMAAEERMIVGDLARQSIMDLWNSSSLLSLVFPEREKYRGNPCYDCPDFDGCLLKNGCYFSSILAYGEPFKPAPFYARICSRYGNSCNYLPFWHI